MVDSSFQPKQFPKMREKNRGNIMLNHTIPIYISKRFMFWGVSLLFFGAVILFVSDLLELVRRTRDFEGYEFSDVSLIAILRLPSLLEQLFPFIALLAGIITFLSLNRYHELVMVKAAGLSVWQIIKPIFLITLVFGILGVIAFNPISIHLKKISDETGEHLFALTGTSFLSAQENIWIRQDSEEGEFIFFATNTNSSRTEFFDVSIIFLGSESKFGERTVAPKAILKQNYWELFDAKVFYPNSNSVDFSTLKIKTYLTQTEINQRIAEPESVSFWELPSIINLTEKAGLPAYRYTLQFHTILSLPLLLTAMVIIAASVAMSYSKMGSPGRIFLVGILTGFILYMMTQFIKNLGGAGMIPPIFAAWSPGVIATMAGILILLYREEG